MRTAAALAVPYLLADADEWQEIDDAIAEDLVRGIEQTVAELPRRAPAQTREFPAETPAAARMAAAAWLQDFCAHGPLEIERVQTAWRGDGFVAVVTYRSAERVAYDATGERRTAERVASTARHRTDAASLKQEPLSEPSAAPPDTGRSDAEPPAVRRLPRVTPLQIPRAERADRSVD